MEEINVFLHVMKSLKNKLLKIVIISAVAALLISTVMLFYDKQDAIYRTDTKYLISYSEEVEILDKDDLIDFLMSSGSDSLEDFENGSSLKDYSIYASVIDSIIHSDYLYEKVEQNIDIQLDKEAFDILVKASVSGGGRVLTISY